MGAAGRSCLRHRAHAAPEPRAAPAKVMEGESLEKAQDMKQNGLEGNLREETGTELGSGSEEHVPVDEGEDAKVQLCPALCSCLENT